MKKLNRGFFLRDAEKVAFELIGKFLCVKNQNEVKKFKITETEAYLGEFDTASHASHGKTERCKIMWEEGGKVYVYLCYGLHFMLNFVCEKAGIAQAVLIRGVEGVSGPGKLTKVLGIDKSFHGEDVVCSERIWLEDAHESSAEVLSSPRIGIDYASKQDREALLRFYIKNQN